MSQLVPGILCWTILQFAGSFLCTVTGFLLVTLLTVSTISDLRFRKIHNALTYSILTAAITWNLIFTCIAGLEAGGITASFFGALWCCLVMLIPYSMEGGGAGDVKLATAIGAILGPQTGLIVIAASYLLAACGIIASAAYRKGVLQLLTSLLQKCLSVVLPYNVLPPTDGQLRIITKPVPLAPFFAAGTIVTLLGVIPS